MSDPVIVIDDGPVRILRLNRPEKKNALTDAMYDILSDALECAAANAALLVMGRPFGAADARDAGLVNEVVPAGEAEAAALTAARHIATLPAEAVALSRRLIRGDAAEIAGRIDEEAALFRQRLKSDEARAAFEAFFSRRG